MVDTAKDLPDDVTALKAALLDAAVRASRVEAELAIARTRALV